MCPLLLYLVSALLLHSTWSADHMMTTTTTTTDSRRVRLMITGEIRGAAFPVDSNGGQCSLEKYQAEPCDCYGGASRRNAILANAKTDPNLVLLDTGAYFYGSGLFFPTFHGKASVQFFAESGYDAFTLTYRDFSAFMNSSDSSGAKGLAAYLAEARELDPTLPAAVMTNAYVQGDRYLDASNSQYGALAQHVQPYTLVPLPGGREMAVLSIVDPTHLMHTSTTNYYTNDIAGAMLEYRKALQLAMWELVQRPQGKPDVVVLIISSVPVTAEELALAGGNWEQAWQSAIFKLCTETLGIDIVLSNVYGDKYMGTMRLVNWAHDNVWVIKVNQRYQGYQMNDVTINFDEAGKIQDVTWRDIYMMCHTTSTGYHNIYHKATDDKLAELHKNVSAAMGAVLNSAFTGPVEGRSVFRPLLPKCTELPVPDEHVCGCRVDSCAAGNLVADALAQQAGTQIALVNSGSIRASLPDNPVTLGDLIQMLPFNNEVVRVTNVQGSMLRAAFEHGLSGLEGLTSYSQAGNAPGFFLQVSSNIRVEWRFKGNRPEIAAILLLDNSAGGFKPLNESLSYSVAMNSYMAGGGDDFHMFQAMSLKKERLGTTVSHSVADYIRKTTFTTAATNSRVSQKEKFTEVHVGLLCKSFTTAIDREQCDSARWAISALNDKTDGFFDDVLPNTILVPVPAEVGCSENLALSGLDSIMEKHPNLLAAIGPSCSNDVRDVSDRSARALRGHQTLFVSPSSTASALADETKYPYVARAVTQDAKMGLGIAEAMLHWGWKRIAILKDDSLWGSGAAQAVSDPFQDGGGQILYDESFSLNRFDAGDVSAATLVDKLAGTEARIIYACTQPRVLRKVFEYVYDSGKLYGKGFAWFSAWITDIIFSQDIKGVMQASGGAVEGGQGLIGLAEQYDSSTYRFQDYEQRWSRVATKEACKVDILSIGDNEFCDSDGVPSTFDTYSPFNVDAVLILAMAMHAVQEGRRLAAHGKTQDGNLLTPQGIYAEILKMDPFDAVAGESLRLDSSGDRLGSYEVRNFQITYGHTRRLRSAGERRLRLSLTATTAEFVKVGTYDTISGLAMDESSLTIFPGGTTEVPLDKEPDPEVIESGWGAGEIILLVCGVLLLGGCLFGVHCACTQYKIRKLKRELEDFKDQIVGVRAVVEDYFPPGMDQSLLDASTSTGMSPDASTMGSASCMTMWYWQEDESRLSAHNQLDVHQPGNFVKFAGSVCAELEEVYSNWKKDPVKCSPDHKLNLTDRIASTGTETKAFAADSGYDFLINFERMIQRNNRTKYERKILRREIEVPKPSVAAAKPQQRSSKKKMTTTSNPTTASKDKPMDLDGEDSLVLYEGQLLQASKQRPDGWAHGTIIFDEVEDRPAPTVEGISISGGWFPLAVTDMPNTAQMQKLQSVMGGAGAADALAMPESWAPVKDPSVHQTFPLKDGPEKQAAIDAFMVSLPPGKVTVVGVERIQNVALWQSYAVKRQTVVQRAPDAKSAERTEKCWLFHGTTADIVPKICEQGFNRSLCGRNATMYGKGVYFARDSSYSAGKQYSSPDSKGVQRMFLCRVVVGEYCQGVRDAPVPKTRKEHILYDTTVDNEKNPSIFVTYHDGQAYPEYLLTFKQ